MPDRAPPEPSLSTSPPLAYVLSRRTALSLCLALLAMAAGATAVAEERPGRDAVEFLRLLRDESDGPVALETSIVRYAKPVAEARGDRPRAAVEVDLVSAVHVGAAGYYETLNRLFTEYDSVLYELVAPPNARVPKPGRKPAGMIGSAQQGLTQLLGLEFQLERVDYTADNFVHADMSPQEFSAAMAKRGESWWTIFMKLMREGMARADQGRPPPGSDIGFGEMFSLLFGSGPDRQVRLRRIMAEQFTDMDVLTATFGGEEGSTLITDRNTAALEVLRDRIAKGDHRIAIFYGAAHMDDFDRRLRADFGLQAQPRETVWLEAWDLREPVAAARR